MYLHFQCVLGIHGETIVNSDVIVKMCLKPVTTLMAVVAQDVYKEVSGVT